MAVYSLLGGMAVARAGDSHAELLARCMLRGGQPLAACRASATIDASNDALLHPALALLPPGRAFAAEPGTIIRAAVDALARDIARVETEAASLGRQLVAGVPGELLREWERAAGLSGDEEQADAAEAESVRSEVLAAGGSVPGYVPLHLRRASAVADQLAPSEPLSIQELERRALATVLQREAVHEPPPSREQVLYPVGVVVSRQLPFRAGLSRVGDPVCGADWLFRYDVTIVAASSFGSSEALADRFLERGRPLLDWLKRSWPPWCGLALEVRIEGAAEAVRILSINLAESAE